MTPSEAARVLGVPRESEWTVVRGAYRDQIRSHHPDHAGEASSGRAARIIEAYRVLEHARDHPEDVAAERPAPAEPPPPPRAFRFHRWDQPEGVAPPVWRADHDTLLLAAPADETFLWLLDAAHDIGEITYVDRSVPILEVLCQFEGEPATSLLLTLQGRSTGTEVFCSVESIEQRPAPPTSAVVDLLELALHRRSNPTEDRP